MQLLLILFFKTNRMKKNWKNIVLYIVRVVEMIITGAAGGAVASL